jgi:agmatinase
MRKTTMPKDQFLECVPGSARDPGAPCAVLPIPCERTVSFGRGTARAPAAILAASLQTETFDEELFRPYDLGIQTLPAVNCRGANTAAVYGRIRAAAKAVLEKNRFLMSLGGEHSVTVPLVAAAREAHGNNFCVLNLDSHLDLRDSFRGRRDSHACVFRRIMEMDVPVVHVGIRSVCREEYDLIRQRKIKVFWARDILASASDRWMGEVIRRLKSRVYLSIDIDVFDPSVVPGTGTPEPGGLAWYTVLRLLRRLCRARRVFAADIVEVAPIPETPLCEYAAAKLALKLINYALKSP